MKKKNKELLKSFTFITIGLVLGYLVFYKGLELFAYLYTKF